MEERCDSIDNASSVVTGCKNIPYNCNIRPLRIALGWTQSDLAREVGFTSNAINMMEREKYFPPLETRIKVSKALKTDSSAVWIPTKLNILLNEGSKEPSDTSLQENTE